MGKISKIAKGVQVWEFSQPELYLQAKKENIIPENAISIVKSKKQIYVNGIRYSNSENPSFSISDNAHLIVSISDD
jgi:hypothetical protein|nr:MAG TPA: hypothetical protein [Caudoviricetes sp.]